MSRNPRGWLLTGESVHKLLLYMFVSASGGLKIQKCCNSVDSLQAHIVFLMRDMIGITML